MSSSSEERRERKAHDARVERALRERIYLLGPVPTVRSASASFLVSGQSGKVYTATLPIAPSNAPATCNCIDQRIRKTVCKHLLFLCIRVFKLPPDSFTSPAIPREAAARYASSDAALAAAGDHAAPPLLRSTFAELAAGALPQPARKPVAARQPAPDDECPICYENLLPEPLAYCVFGCGRPVHAECFERYERAANEEAKCVLCRLPWRQQEGGKPLGRSGVLVGRRLVDLSEEVPFMYEELPQPVRRKASAKRGRASTGGASSSAQGKKPVKRKVAPGSSSSSASVGKPAPAVMKRRSGRATAEARAAAAKAREAKGGRVTRADARRANEGS